MASKGFRHLIHKSAILFTLLGGTAHCFAYSDDTHYTASFAIALAFGFGWEQSLLIASANQAVDTNVFTKPTIHTGLGRGATSNEVRQFEKCGASLGLSLQDYYFHCFSPVADKRGERSSVVEEHLKSLEANANELIDNSNSQKSAEATTRALVAIGIYLHCQQDSWSHSSYGDHAVGHIADDIIGQSPDELPRYPTISRKALAETIDKLERFREKFGLKRPTPTKEELGQLVNALIDEPAGHNKTIPVPDRKICNQKATEYWVARLIKAYPELYDQSVPADTYEYTITPVVYETVYELQKGPPQPRVVAESYLINWPCQELFAKAFPEIRAKRRPDTQSFHNITRTIDWADPVHLSFVKLPPEKLPLFKVQLSVNPVFNDKSDYER